MKKKKEEIIISVAAGVSKALLVALFAGAIVVAPGGVQGVLHVFNKLFDENPEYDPDQLNKSLMYLRSRKLIDIQNQYGQAAYRLTRIGAWRARKLMNYFAIKKPRKWDGKFRLVIFDIPVRRKNRGDGYRNQLKKLGLAHIQKSIWVHPFECRDQVYYLANQSKIAPYVRYVVAEDITGYEDLRKKFSV